MMSEPNSVIRMYFMSMQQKDLKKILVIFWKTKEISLDLGRNIVTFANPVLGNVYLAQKKLTDL